MQPTAPETGFGYSSRATPSPRRPAPAPSPASSKSPLRGPPSASWQGRHLWNAGIFVFTAGQLARCSPPRPGCWPPPAAPRSRSRDLDFIRLDPAAFAAGPEISIDYAVAEHTDRAGVVPAAIGWSDVGSWVALWELGDKDAAATWRRAMC